MIRIGGAALNQTPIDWKNNFQNVVTAIEHAQQLGIQILCLPELCLTGYGCEDLFLHDWVIQKSNQLLVDLLPYTKNISVCVGLPIKYENKIYNASCFMSNEKILGFSCKQFLANEGVHYEYRWFTPWPSQLQKSIQIQNQNYPIGDLIYEVHGLKIGFEICEDAWQKEQRPCYGYKANHIDLVLNPSASHFSFHKSDVRYQLVKEGSEIIQGAYVYANLLGNEAGRIIYDGEVLISYQGNLLQRNKRLSFQNVEVHYADIDFKTQQTSHTELTNDIRSKEYEFWEATSLGLFDYLRKSKSKGFVLSLSGGADSSTCAIMVFEMIHKGIKELGLEAFLKKINLTHLFQNDVIHFNELEQSRYVCQHLLTCVYQASRNSGDDTFLSAQELANSIGAQFYDWSIDEEVESYKTKIEKAIQRPLTWEQDDIALQNIQARSRSPIIWMLANIQQALLITTSNRSEGDVGYATMDGDTSGSIAPIAGVDKDFIRKWLLWAEKEKNHTGLHRVNRLTPTAELRPTERVQTDEKDLMPYDLLAKIEREAIYHRLSPMQVYEVLEHNFEDKTLLKKYLVKFFRMWSINQWKRERIAPSFHLDEFNVDSRSWCRFPILSGAYQEEIKALEAIHEWQK
jgi:NAD+ synthase (glutamine-hydrolysing)